MSGVPRLHPWNRDFTWREHSGPLRRVSREQADAYHRDGFFVLPDAVTEETLADLRAAIDPVDDTVTGLVRRAPEGKVSIAIADTITFVPHLVKHAPAARHFATSALFADLCHDLIGPDARLYWDQSVYKRSEVPREFPWHQDNGYTYVEPQQYLTCWLALTDATRGNGAPWVVPRLHRRGTLDHWLTEIGWRCLDAPADAVSLEVPAGHLAVFSSLTPHRTGPNTSDAVRKAYILQYAPEGAEMLQGDPAQAPIARAPQNAPDRQLPVLRGGEPVEAAG